MESVFHAVEKTAEIDTREECVEKHAVNEIKSQKMNREDCEKK